MIDQKFDCCRSCKHEVFNFPHNGRPIPVSKGSNWEEREKKPREIYKINVFDKNGIICWRADFSMVQYEDACTKLTSSDSTFILLKGLNETALFRRRNISHLILSNKDT